MIDPELHGVKKEYDALVRAIERGRREGPELALMVSRCVDFDACMALIAQARENFTAFNTLYAVKTDWTLELTDEVLDPEEYAKVPVPKGFLYVHRESEEIHYVQGAPDLDGRKFNPLV